MGVQRIKWLYLPCKFRKDDLFSAIWVLLPKACITFDHLHKRLKNLQSFCNRCSLSYFLVLTFSETLRWILLARVTMSAQACKYLQELLWFRVIKRWKDQGKVTKGPYELQRELGPDLKTHEWSRLGSKRHQIQGYKCKIPHLYVSLRSTAMVNICWALIVYHVLI